MTRPPPHRPAFTLAELVVVTVTLAVLAGVMMPRLVRRDGRAAAQTAESVRQLLSAAAQRQTLTSQRLALDLSPGPGGGLRLSLLVPSDADPREGSADAWRPDPLVVPVVMADAQPVGGAAGDQRLDAARWRVELSSESGRPAVAIVLREADGARAWRVELPSEAVAARVVVIDPGDAGSALTAPGVVDLDDTGMRDQPW